MNFKGKLILPYFENESLSQKDLSNIKYFKEHNVFSIARPRDVLHTKLAYE